MSGFPGLAHGDADGVASATHTLYKQYGAQIHTYCRRRLRSAEEAEDAVQTTFLNAFRALQRGTTPQAEQAWLYKIAQHVCDARGSSVHRVETPARFELLDETVAAPARETDELYGLEEALEAMPANQRRAIVLREWRGLSYREIAEELHLTQTAVEMLLFRARRALAAGLEAPAVKPAKRLYAAV
jgi:RNA polymerase sigma-70 factor, ECF subfamily